MIGWFLKYKKEEIKSLSTIWPKEYNSYGSRYVYTHINMTRISNTTVFSKKVFCNYMEYHLKFENNFDNKLEWW